MEKIDVVLYGCAEFAGFLKSCIESKGRFVRLAGVCAHVREIAAVCSGLTHPVLVLADAKLPRAEAESLIHFAATHGIRVLAVAENVQTGFDLLKMGATDMIIHNDAVASRGDMLFANAFMLKINAVHSGYFAQDKHVMKSGAPRPEDVRSRKVIAIGSSTGGAETVKGIVCQLPADMPPILIVQHMPPVFTRMYTEQLNSISSLTVWEAADGDVLRPGLVLMAPGESQMRLARRDGRLVVALCTGERYNGHCPSVDVLFQSVAKTAGRNAIGVILTGMGTDGANGLLEMKRNGAFTIGQDEESSVVYGMPKAARLLGAVDVECHARDIAKLIRDNI